MGFASMYLDKHLFLIAEYNEPLLGDWQEYRPLACADQNNNASLFDRFDQRHTLIVLEKPFLIDVLHRLIVEIGNEVLVIFMVFSDRAAIQKFKSFVLCNIFMLQNILILVI